MARILIAWEMGANFGHVARQLPVAARLRDAGHEVLFAVRDLGAASEVLRPAAFAFVQGPCHTGMVRVARPPANYSEILLAEGYGDLPSLHGRLGGWMQLFAMFRADAIVVDHAPTALIAAHAAGLPAVQIGCGFVIPPDVSPFPSIRPWDAVEDEALAKSDALVSRLINACLSRLRAQPLQRVQDLIAGTPRLLTTFAELDHYGARDGADYAGPLYWQAQAPAPQWRTTDRPRILAYLRNGTPGLRAALASLRASGAEVICALPGISIRQSRAISTPACHVVPYAIPLSALLSEASIVVCHGGVGTAAQSMLSGVPLLFIPSSVEQQLHATRFERLGSAISMGRERTVQHFTANLARLISDRAHAERAAQFAAHHAGFDPDVVAARGATLVERALGERSSRVN